MKKFKATCRYCNMIIFWNETHRQWDRVTPNKTFEDQRHQHNTCGQATTGWHDPKTPTFL